MTDTRTVDDLLAPVAGPVDDVLREVLSDGVPGVDDALHDLLVPLRALVEAGGKRLRPAFVHWGHVAVGGDTDTEHVVQLGAAVELLHVFALVHDDVMDRSPARRGAPTVHTALEARHRDHGWAGDAAWFGASTAILAGDLALTWSEQLLTSLPLEPATRRRLGDEFALLRTEVITGQYLDLVAAARPHPDGDLAERVALLKSGRYTVGRPIALGAALADDAPAATLAALRTYGDRVGTAFQLHDDLLGVFGDDDVTGKGAVDDLRERKGTLLLAWTVDRAAPSDRRWLLERWGASDVDHDDLARLRGLAETTGARAEVAARCDRLVAEATDALVVVPPPARDALADLARFVVARRA